MEKQSDWAKRFQRAAGEIIARVKHLETSQEWIQNGTSPCRQYKLSIDGRVASMGVHICEFPMDEVIQFLKQEESLKKMNFQLMEIKVLLEKENVFKVHYMQYKGLWPVWNRDFVNVAVPFAQNKNKIYIGTKACDYPYPEQQGAVRAEVFIAGYIIQKIDENHTQVTYISDADLKGNIPNWLKNKLSQLQGSIAYKVQEVMKKEKSKAC